MKTEIKPFNETMIQQAGKLLVERHKRNRAEMTLLPARFEDANIATKAVESMWQKKQKSGYAAFNNGKMTAYLLGDFSVQAWGRCGYVYYPGYALAEGEDPSLIQDLYAKLGDDWTQYGVFYHALYVAASDTNIIQALFNIGFGKERVDALLDLTAIEIPKIDHPKNISIRRSGKEDNDHLGDLSPVIMKALAEAPYWHPTVPEDWNELREGWSELADDQEWTVWLALQDNQALGTVGFRAENEDDSQMLVASNTAYLSVAATKPEARGRGISTALTWHGLKQSREDGYKICYTNWISSNFLASRFWPRFGFKDVAYRLSKRINPMVAWTRQ